MINLPTSLVMKLASLAVHADEFTSEGGHYLDCEAIKALVVDPDVVEFVQDMQRQALAPLKRSQK